MIENFKLEENQAEDFYFAEKLPGNIPELFVPSLLQSDYHEIDCLFSPNNRFFFFTRSKLDFSETKVFFLERENKVWKKPKSLDFPKQSYLSGVSFSYTQDRIYLNIFEKAEKPRMAIYYSDYTNNKWFDLSKLEIINSADSHTSYASISKNENLYFHSNREKGLGGFDLYFSEFKDGNYLPPKNLGEPVNSELNEFHPWINPNEEYLIYDIQKKPSNIGTQDLYISFKLKDNTWTPPENLGKEVNSEAAEFRARITPDGKYLLFSSNRTVDTTKRGIQNLFWVATDFIKDIKQKYM